MKNTPEKWEEICHQLLLGMSRDDACTMAGVHRGTFYRWLKNATFATQVNQAELRNKQVQMARIQNASQTDWRAAAYWLEKKYPEEFGKKQPNSSGKMPFFEIFQTIPEENRTDQLVRDGRT